ncbi:MAG: right-handed parallel beta-helix repeat-containing protein [Halioglobus sp.]
MIGCDRADQRIEITSDSHLDPSCVYTGGFDISTSNVTLDCRRALIQAQGPTSLRGITIAAPENTALTGVTVRSCLVQGFLNNVRVLREGFRSFEPDEEYLYPTSEIVLEKNYFGQSHGVGVYIDAYVSGVTVRTNLIAETGSAGIYLETGSRQNTIEDNFIINNGFRENGPNGQPTILGGVDFWFWGVGREGIAVDGSYENTIRHNVLSGNSAGGIFLYKNCGEFPESPRYFERRFPSDRNLIEDNTFWGGRNGIWVGSRMGENTLPMECTDDAYILEPLRRVVLDYAADNTIRANVFQNVTYGIRVEDDGNRVIGNEFFGDAPGYHAVIIGTPDRTAVLGRPVTGTVLKNNSSHINGNKSPYRWVHGHEDTLDEGNSALGDNVELCEGETIPRQPLIFVIAAALAGPGGTAPDTTPDLTVPTLGALEECP